jgi:hypothetical protein
MTDTNWKLKYQELKSKYMNSVDVAFRLGVEEGMKQSSLDNANQQLQQAQIDKQNMPSGSGEDGKPNNNGAVGTPDQGVGADKSGAPSIQPETPEAVPMQESEHPEGTELDQHIAKLEGMIAKSEELNVNDLKKTIDDLKSLQKYHKEQTELKKSAAAITKIAASLHKPQFKFGVQAQHNLNSTAKSAASMHHKIVNDIMQKWESEENKAGKDIMSALKVDGIIKDE